MDDSTREFTDERARIFHEERLQKAATQQRVNETLSTVPIFAGLEEEARWRLAQHARELRFAAGTLVVIEGDETDGFYVIARGSADVMRAGERGELVPVARLERGGYFGELGLLSDTRRGATVMASDEGDLEVLVFDAQTFHEIIAEHVLVFRMQRARKRLQAVANIDAVTLAQLPPFSDLAPDDLDRIMSSAEERDLARGETVFDQGRKGDRFYVLLRGALEVERDGERVGALGAGEFFGETALLFTKRRTATVRAVLPSTVWSITRSSFGRLVRTQLLNDSESYEVLEQRWRAS